VPVGLIWEKRPGCSEFPVFHVREKLSVDINHGLWALIEPLKRGKTTILKLYKLPLSCPGMMNKVQKQLNKFDSYFVFPFFQRCCHGRLIRNSSAGSSTAVEKAQFSTGIHINFSTPSSIDKNVWDRHYDSSKENLEHLGQILHHGHQFQSILSFLRTFSPKGSIISLTSCIVKPIQLS